MWNIYTNSTVYHKRAFDKVDIKVHIFWEGHKILQNIQSKFDCYYIGRIYSKDFAKFCGILRTYKLLKYLIIFRLSIFKEVAKKTITREQKNIYILRMY